MLAVTVTAQLVTVPFLVWYFHQIVPLSLVSNLLLVPAMEAAVLLFLPVLALSLLAPAMPARQRPCRRNFSLSGVLQAGRWLAAPAGIRRNRRRLGMASFVGILRLPGSGPGRRDPVSLCLPDPGGSWWPCWRHFYSCRPSRPASVPIRWMSISSTWARATRLYCEPPGGRAVLLDTGGLRGYDTGRQIVLPYLRFYGLTRAGCSGVEPWRRRPRWRSPYGSDVPAGAGALAGTGGRYAGSSIPAAPSAAGDEGGAPAPWRGASRRGRFCSSWPATAAGRMSSTRCRKRKRTLRL
jgi:hypothetical protein